jgi:hypothetical protein
VRRNGHPRLGQAKQYTLLKQHGSSGGMTGMFDTTIYICAEGLRVQIKFFMKKKVCLNSIKVC